MVGACAFGVVLGCVVGNMSAASAVAAAIALAFTSGGAAAVLQLNLGATAVGPGVASLLIAAAANAVLRRVGLKLVANRGRVA
jgi:hypothetical protein